MTRINNHLGAAAAAALGIAYGLVFFYAPNDADQGFVQKIFYLHVPLGIVSLGGFVAGGLMGLRFLRTRDRKWDLRSYVAIHLSLILSVGVLATGSIWARASWGVWWTWSENQLVLFLVLFLFYCAYFMLRFSLDAGPPRMNMSAVYALFGVVLIPVSFLAIRLSQRFIHPVVFDSHAPSNMTGAQWLSFLVSFAAMLLLFATLYNVELAGKRIDAHLRELRELLS